MRQDFEDQTRQEVKAVALAEQIVEWVGQRPSWQREVMLRVAQGNILADHDYERLIDKIVDPPPEPAVEFGLEHLPDIPDQAPAVRLKSIARIEHVNALASPQPLTFGPCGLTIVYGDNGSGKSGYARLLKRITKARHREEVLSDVFRDTARDKPSASLDVSMGDRDRTVTWPESSRSELERMHFYDRDCMNAYISTEAHFPYRPAELDVMHGLINACVAVRERIDRRLAANAQAAERLPTVGEEVNDTAAGRFLEQLSDRTSIESLDELIASLDDASATLDQVRMEEHRLRNADSGREQRHLLRQAAKLEDLHRHIEGIHALLGPDGLAKLQVARDRLGQGREAIAQLARAFASEPLPGVGSSPWQVLWDAAKRFSVEHAYPDRSFPFVDDESRCVLCQQTLEAEGRARLRRFEEFVKEDTQVQFEEARQAYESLTEELARANVSTEAVANHLRDLESGHADLMQGCGSLLARYQQVQENALDALSGTETLALTDIEPAGILAQLAKAAASTQQAAATLGDPEAVQQQLAQVVVRRQELELLQEIRHAREAFVKEIQRLQERTALEEAKAAAATGPITRKITEFTEAAITEEVRDRFIRETDRLRLERVTLERTRAEKGSVLHKPKLVSARQAVPLPRVFSEGERLALGLAAFFTEVQLDGSQSAIILDDPVTSLDHNRRELVAARLSRLAARRQVIVFTHDLAFVADLKGSAAARDVRVAERSVERSSIDEGKPGICTTGHPWKAKDVGTRLGELESELARLKREAKEGSITLYEERAALWAGRLSETWERIFSQEIVGLILAEGGLEVRPRMVRILACFTDEDYREFDASYSRVSKWAKRHDKSVHVNYVPPRISNLEEEFQQVKTWFKRIRQYRK